MAETAKGPVEVVELSRPRQAAARRAAEARATVPHFAVTIEAAAPAAADPVPALVAAAAGALRVHPAVNGAYRDGRLERYSRVNVAVVMPGPQAPVAPVVFDADVEDLPGIEAHLARARTRAAAGELTAPELAGATFALEVAAARRFEPVVAPGFAAVLGAGEAETRAAVVSGAVVAAARMDLTLACDARALSVAEACAFLASVKALLGA